MGCCGDREKGRTVTEEQKWDYITLSDFKTTSCWPPLSYFWLWMLVIVSVAVYVADAFTCITLLAFNKWTSQVQPKVDFKITKWIFAICIIVSYVFLVYRYIRAVRTIRSGGVAESYLDPLAAVLQSIRIFGQGQGYRRFLVFAALTKSSKGIDYIAIFAYFQFQGALLIVIAQGPRIAINALTLWAVMQAKLIPVGENAAPKDRSPVAQFFINIEVMAQQGNKMETITYFTMLFSLVIWVIAALSLILSVIFYLIWLCVAGSDGKLSVYCRKKIDTRLERIVNKKVRKALEKQDHKRRKEEQQAIREGGSAAARIPTLPKLGGKDDDASSVFSLPRSDAGTLPPYSSQPPSRNGTVNTTTSSRPGMKPSLPSVSERPPPSRSDTQGTAFSGGSYNSNSRLLDDAGSMGATSPLYPAPPLDRNADYFTPLPAGSRLPPINTGWQDGRASPSSQLNGPPRSNTGFNPNRRMPNSPLNNPNFAPYDNRGPGPARGPAYEMSPVDMTPSDDYPRGPQLPSSLRPGTPTRNNANLPYPPSNNTSFTSPPPSRSGTAPPGNPRAGLPATLQSAIQRREASNLLPGRAPMGGVDQQRSATVPIQQPGWGPRPGMRSNTTAPPGSRGPYGGGPGNANEYQRNDGW